MPLVRSFPFLVFALAALMGCSPPPSNTIPAILVFAGTGSSSNDVKAIESILKAHHLDYTTADSDQLNRLSQSRLLAYRLLVVPGGNYIQMGNSLSPAAAANVRGAVAGGLNFLGICAGGLLAGDGPHRQFNLTDGVRFDFYAVVNQGIHKTTAAVTSADGTTFDHYWEDGPQFTGWGQIVAKYPDGTPAVVQGAVGKGWVVLCGVHPKAPEHWRSGMQFATPASEDQAYAAKLIDAALNRRVLPSFDRQE